MNPNPSQELTDQIWADEPNVMVRFDRQSNGRVVITLLDITGTMWPGREIAHATLGGWRWDRAVKAMTRPSPRRRGKERSDE